MQSNAKQSKAERSNAKQFKAMHSNAKQCKVIQCKAKQCKTMQRKAMRSKAMQSNKIIKQLMLRLSFHCEQERQKQIYLAKARGEEHIGKQIKNNITEEKK